MRSINRLLVFASELGVLVLGFVLSFALALGVATANGTYSSTESPLASTLLVSGLLATIVGFVALRRKHRPWKIEYDAIGWTLTRAERRLYPRREGFKRIVFRILIWVPSAIAALVLFFLPVATHVVNPRSHYVRPYRIPIPWNVAVFPSFGPPEAYSQVLAFASGRGAGRFGMTPFWDSRRLTSEMHFGSVDPDASSFMFDPTNVVAADELRREFQFGDVKLNCWQYVHPYRYAIRVGPSPTEPFWWNIDCRTPANVRQQNLYAWFLGRAEDIPAFYKIIERITPVK